MSREGCASCTVTRDDRGREHHAAGCPELRWPDGHLRGSDCGADELPALRPLQDPSTYRFSNPGGLSPVGIEMAGIFSTLERKVET